MLFRNLEQDKQKLQEAAATASAPTAQKSIANAYGKVYNVERTVNALSAKILSMNKMGSLERG